MSERPWVVVGRGNWLRFDPVVDAEIDAIVDRLDRDYGNADMAGRYAAAWLDVARLLSTLAAVTAHIPDKREARTGQGPDRFREALREARPFLNASTAPNVLLRRIDAILGEES